MTGIMTSSGLFMDRLGDSGAKTEYQKRALTSSLTGSGDAWPQKDLWGFPNFFDFFV